MPWALAPGNPPIEARVVDQHDRVGLVMAEVAVGPAGQGQKLMQVEQHAQKPHHGQHREVGVQLATGGGHAGAAIADRFQLGTAGAQGANQVRGVQVATRLADGKEDLHGSVRSLESLGICAGREYRKRVRSA